MNNQTSKKSVKGRNGGTLNPGYYGQKNGRKKKIPELESILAESLSEGEGMTVIDRIIKTLIQKAIKGDMKAIEYLLNRAYGKPKEKIENTVKSENEIVILKIPDNGRNP